MKYYLMITIHHDWLKWKCDCVFYRVKKNNLSTIFKKKYKNIHKNLNIIFQNTVVYVAISWYLYALNISKDFDTG